MHFRHIFVESYHHGTRDHIPMLSKRSIFRNKGYNSLLEGLSITLALIFDAGGARCGQLAYVGSRVLLADAGC